MSRRGLGRGRLLVGLGAVLALVAVILPWFTVGGQALPARSGNGLEGAGIAIFVAAVGLLAVLALPYASRDARSSLDRPLTFLVLAGIAVVALGVRLYQLFGAGLLGFPDRAPGLWLGAAGVLLICWGVAEILAEPPPIP